MAVLFWCSNETMQTCKQEVRRKRNRERWRSENPDWDKGLDKKCEWCNKEFKTSPRYKNTKFCSNKCRDIFNSRVVKGHREIAVVSAERKVKKEIREKKLKEERLSNTKNKICNECGEVFATHITNKLTCSTKCSKKRKNRLSYMYSSKRLNNNNIIDKDISLEVLYKRDKGICYLCGDKCNYSDCVRTETTFTSGKTYPSIDHIVPIARGGKHAWDNVKLAHHYCNSMKSDILPSEYFGKEITINVDEAYALARKVSQRKKKVYQYNLEMKLLNAYESTAEAGRRTGIPSKSIQKCARKEINTTHSFIFKYKQN
ncbi:hypothetical protein BKX95_08390 [Streptococcus iniae]|nr:hypothetical protein BKX95_08390 [Streptococcus iniae]